MKLAPGRVVGASEHIHKYVQTYRCIAEALASIFKYGFKDANIRPPLLSVQTQLGVHHCSLFIYCNSVAQIDERKLSRMQRGGAQIQSKKMNFHEDQLHVSVPLIPNIYCYRFFQWFCYDSHLLTS